MSSQKFSFEEREAIWSAYNKKCIYSSEPLKIDNFHIDHIIPEEYSWKKIEFKELASNLGLGESFDIFGFENLVPCTPNANLRKNKLLFEKSAMLFYLKIAQSKKKRIIENLEKINRRNNKGKASVHILQYLEQGRLSPDEVSDILEKYRESPQAIFDLLKELKFEGSDDIDRVAKENIDTLMTMPVKMGDNEHISGLDLWSEQSGEIHVSSCNDYEKAILEGFLPKTNADIKLSVFFEHQCGLLKALKKASIPSESYLDKPHRGIVDLNLLPFTYFPYIGEIDGEYKGDETYQDKINKGELFIKRVEHNSITIEEPEGMGQLLIEVVRADFDGDGVEDILLYEYCYATHGTLGFGGIRVLTRKCADGFFEEVNI